MVLGFTGILLDYLDRFLPFDYSDEDPPPFNGTTSEEVFAVLNFLQGRR